MMVAATWSVLGATEFSVALTLAIGVVVLALCFFCPHGGYGRGDVESSQWERWRAARENERASERNHEYRMERIRLGLDPEEGR